MASSALENALTVACIIIAVAVVWWGIAILAAWRWIPVGRLRAALSSSSIRLKAVTGPLNARRWAVHRRPQRFANRPDTALVGPNS